MLDSENGLPRKLVRKPDRNTISVAAINNKSKAADELRARNAYRAACGLPLIEPGND